MPARTDDYWDVTETAGTLVTEENLSMAVTRYSLAASFASDRDVLEIACGAGQGLGYLARQARMVVGGDYTQRLLGTARQHYGARIPLVRLDAHRLPFRAQSFDTVLLYEAIYYLDQPGHFVAECRRVLRSEGVLLICSTNREWDGFNPSPHSTRYLSGSELVALARSNGFDAELFLGHPAATKTVRQRFVSRIKQIAVKWNLIPKTMRGKQLLKRLFLGPLCEQPAELVEGLVAGETPVRVDSSETTARHKVLYLVAHRGREAEGGQQ